MKKLFAVLILMALTACATTQSAQTSVLQGCDAYVAAMTTASDLRDAGKLSTSDIATVTAIRKTIGPICESKTAPVDPTAATQQVTAAVTTLTVNIIANKVSK